MPHSTIVRLLFHFKSTKIKYETVLENSTEEGFTSILADITV